MRLIDADALINDILTDYGCDPKYIADETIDGLKPYTDQLILERIGLQPTITASPWHRAEEPPKEDGKYVAINVKTKWWYEARYENGNWKAVDLFGQRWVVIHPTHWMPIEPPGEEV